MIEAPGQGERPAVHTSDSDSNPGKPLFVLNEKGVEFDHLYISLPEFAPHAPDYLAINPQGTVPALVHRGRVFVESVPMSEYIDKAFDGPSLTPDDPGMRYRMRDRCRRTGQPVPIGIHVRELDAALTRGTWLVGDDFTLADILTFACFYALPADYPEFATESHAPRVLDWLRRIYARPATAMTFGMTGSIGRRAHDVAEGLGCAMPRAVTRA